MKKFFTSLMSVLFIATMAKAQTSGGPDAYGYTWQNSNNPGGPVFNWIEIDSLAGAVTVIGLGDDNIKGPFALTVPLHFYWYDPSQFYVGSNGYLGFTSTPVAQPFPPIPTAGGIQDYLAVMASDLTFTGTAGPVPNVSCKYWQSPANDSLIVSWQNVPFWEQNAQGYTGINTFQLIYSALDSSITYQYLLQNGVYQNPVDFVTIGIENNSGAIGLQHSHDVLPIGGVAIKFYYPDSVTLSSIDASVSYTGNSGSKGMFLSGNGAAYLSRAEVKNTGIQNLSPFNVDSRIIDAASVIQVSDTVQANALTPGQSQLITFPDTWTPTLAGAYTHIATTLLTDSTPTNDHKDLELQVLDTTLTDIVLAFDNGTASAAGISWLGGGGGIGMHFVPPFYPCYINKVGAYIVDDPDAVGYSLQIFKDDGPNATPLTQLDSIFNAAGTFTIGQYNESNTTTPAIPITSGGFYVAWMMGGASIVLGQDGIPPFSFQSYEILGVASNPNVWAEYRNAEVVDPIIHAVISSSPVGIQEVNSSNHDIFGEFYPNPAKSKTKISFNLDENTNLTVNIYDLNGQLLHTRSSENVPAGPCSFEVDMKGYDAGIYFCKIIAGNNEYQRKITLIK